VPNPQPGIFAEGTTAHHHLELTLLPGAAPDALRRALRDALEPAAALPTAGAVNVVVGFGPELWRALAPGSPPAHLRAFAPIEGDGRSVPATQRDLWVWAHGGGRDDVFDTARHVARCLAPVARLAAEQEGFVYHDSRDLTGFVDGTENPDATEAPTVALLADGVAGAGGSHAITMRWEHDLDAFDALAESEQEAVIGRTKPDSVELAGGAKPPTAHISRVVVEVDGEELEIFRRSIPYGGVTVHGLFFVAFAADPSRFDRMLARMFGTEGDGLHDRLTDFSTAATASAWFVPSLDDLRAVLEP